MTDLFKNIVNSKSSDFYQFIKDKPQLIQENVLKFEEEMRDIKISDATCFVILGTEKSITANFFRQYFQKYFANNKIIYHRHYSSRGSDKEWVESIWESLNIASSFSEIIEKYK